MADGEQTINPLPQAQSDFLEVLDAFLQREDAQRLAMMFRGWVVTGGIQLFPPPGLTMTPSPLVAFPGGYYITESNSITFTDNVTSWVIANKDTVGDLGPYLRVPGTHYLVQVAVTAATIPIDSVRLMRVTTAGGTITGVIDERYLFPEFIGGPEPHIRLEGSEVTAKDLWLGESSGTLLLQQNSGTSDLPAWLQRIQWNIPGNKATFNFEVLTGARVYTFPNKSDTVAMLSDISASVFAPGTRMIFDQDVAPVGWMRDAVLNDRVLRVVSGVRTPNGGSWTVGGLTTAAHQHEAPTNQYPVAFGGEEHIDDGFFTGSGTFRSFFRNTVSAGVGVVSRETVLTGPATSQGVSSDATWRPLYRDVIIAEKT